MKDPRGKVAVVTGAGAGIGREVALALAALRATVAVCDNRAEAASGTRSAIEAAGGRATAHVVDVSDEEQMRLLVKDVVAEHDVVDIVVNNAGIAMGPTLVADLPLERFRSLMAVNFWGTVHGSLLFLPHLRQRPQANLVNVASNSALFAVHSLGAYSTSKFAVRGFTENLRMELHGSPVRVSLVFPGATATKMMANSPLIDDRVKSGIQEKFDNAWGQPPTKVAARIVAGLRNDKGRILIGPDTRIADIVSRLLPSAYPRLLQKSMEKAVEKSLGKAPTA